VATAGANQQTGISTHSCATRRRNTTSQSFNTRANHCSPRNVTGVCLTHRTTRTRAALPFWLLLLSVRGVVVAAAHAISQRARAVAANAVVERSCNVCGSRLGNVAAPSATVCFRRRQASSRAKTACVTADAMGMRWLSAVALRQAATETTTTCARKQQRPSRAQ
jgi:hypothetical protein